MKSALLAAVIWRGLFVGVEQTADYRTPLQPGISATAVAIVSVGKIDLRAAYIRPFNRDVAPMVQIGASVKVF